MFSYVDVKKESFLVGYVYNDNDKYYDKKVYLKNTPENICNFIVSDENDKVLCSPLDLAVISTFGSLINEVCDQQYLQNDILPILIPLQQSGERPKYETLYDDEEDDGEE